MPFLKCGRLGLRLGVFGGCFVCDDLLCLEGYAGVFTSDWAVFLCRDCGIN